MFKHDTKKKITIYILYGSHLGYALSVAEHLYELIEDNIKPLKIEFQSLNEIIENDKIGEIHKDDFVIILLSTTGDGEFPQNSNKFYRFLKKYNKPLENIKYCILGFGDTNYNSYCRPAKILDKKLLSLQATKFIKTVCNDDAIHNTDIVDKWLENIINYLTDYKSNLIQWFLKSMAS